MKKNAKIVNHFELVRRRERENDSWCRYDWKDENGENRFSFCMTVNTEYERPWCYMQLFTQKNGPKGDSVEIVIRDREVRAAGGGVDYEYSAVIYGHSAEGSAMTLEGIDSYIEELRLAQDVVRELERRFFKDWAKEMAIAKLMMPDEGVKGDE